MNAWKKYKAVAVGGLLAGSLLIPAAGATDDFRADRRELRHDQRMIDRDYEQLLRDRAMLDEHLRMGAGPRVIARDEARIREDEAQLRHDEAELRRDRREFAANYGWWNSTDQTSRYYRSFE